MKFRQWCHEKWYEHCDEVEAWTGHSPLYLSDAYFNKYKWWLRREFRSVVQQQREDFSPYNTANS